MTTATGNRYQITSMSEGDKQTVKTVRADLTWEDASKFLVASPDANIDYALESLAYKGAYTFHDAHGKRSEIILHKR